MKTEDTAQKPLRTKRLVAFESSKTARCNEDSAISMINVAISFAPMCFPTKETSRHHRFRCPETISPRTRCVWRPPRPRAAGPDRSVAARLGGGKHARRTHVAFGDSRGRPRWMLQRAPTRLRTVWPHTRSVWRSCESIRDGAARVRLAAIVAPPQRERILRGKHMRHRNDNGKNK